MYFFKNIYQIDHILGHRTIFNKLKGIQVIINLFHDQNEIKLDVNNIKISGKYPKYLKTKNTLLNNPQNHGVKQEQN